MTKKIKKLISAFLENRANSSKELEDKPADYSLFLTYNTKERIEKDDYGNESIIKNNPIDVLQKNLINGSDKFDVKIDHQDFILGKRVYANIDDLSKHCSAMIAFMGENGIGTEQHREIENFDKEYRNFGKPIILLRDQLLKDKSNSVPFSIRNCTYYKLDMKSVDYTEVKSKIRQSIEEHDADYRLNKRIKEIDIKDLTNLFRPYQSDENNKTILERLSSPPKNFEELKLILDSLKIDKEEFIAKLFIRNKKTNIRNNEQENNHKQPISIQLTPTTYHQDFSKWEGKFNIT